MNVSLNKVFLNTNKVGNEIAAPPSMGFSRQEYWSGLLFLSPGDLPDPGIKPKSPALRRDSLPSEPPGEPWNSGLEDVLTKHSLGD